MCESNSPIASRYFQSPAASSIDWATITSVTIPSSSAFSKTRSSWARSSFSEAPSVSINT